jgi:hypothetical protein
MQGFSATLLIYESGYAGCLEMFLIEAGERFSFDIFGGADRVVERLTNRVPKQTLEHLKIFWDRIPRLVRESELGQFFLGPEGRMRLAENGDLVYIRKPVLAEVRAA